MGSTGTTPAATNNTVETRPGHHVIAVLLALCAFALGYVMMELDTFTTSFPAGSGTSSSSSSRSRHDQCGTVCEIRRTSRLEHFDGRDLLNRHDLKKQLEDAKSRLIDSIKIDYGEYFDKMFVNPKDGSYIPLLPYGNQSLPLLKRKLMIKVLKTQQELQKVESNVNGCDCTHPDDEFIPTRRQRKLQTGVKNSHSSDAALIESTFTKYVWATGGHSAAAGHGNLYNESYTAYMERELKDVFGSIGIDFEGRNYAMGGTGSAPEFTMCWEEILGRNVDFFSWDFGMTDVSTSWRLFIYAYRGLLSPGRPAFYAKWSYERLKHQMRMLTELGFPVFYSDDDMEKERKELIPETTTLGSKEIEALPTYMKYFKCGGATEKGDCDNEHKYSAPCFNQREGMASWHPGYKLHALWGHSMALYLMQTLISAVDDLVSLESESDEALLSRLEAEENRHYDQLLKKDPLNEELRQNFDTKVGYNFDKLPPLDPPVDWYALFLTGKSICHTVRLPSEIRYKGFLTNSKKTGGPSVYGEETFDMGLEVEEAKADENPETIKDLQLVWDANHPQRKRQCPLVIAPDSKDYYFTQHGDGWRNFVIPNAATRAAYDYNPNVMKGIVIFVLFGCDWGNCPEYMLTAKDLCDGKKLDIKINNIPVTNLTDIGNGAILAVHENGITFPQGSTGGYNLEFHVNEPKYYTKLSSVIVF
ncbi:hypothetical protein IV203_007319 [Nitzschia inconspicua]|uniref:Uncharacterized protein n=1 Tax=Nitzschia inconspicua TaxID=303405 RepID=A0A9K3KEE1_9STRA|nr:hypothetical protein IV203_007319 [Nitzschia inconspicua]